MNSPQSDTSEQLQDLYRTGVAVRTAGLNQEQATAHYLPYVEFVQAHQPSGKLLDVGCGVGWSTAVFAHRGYDATGIDLNPLAFEPPTQSNLVLQLGSALEIPFADREFDVVTSYQVLEHVPDPRQMLTEMLRVTRPGGVVCVVGPNLLGLSGSMMGIVKYVWKARPVSSIFFRNPAMPHHPFGNTLPETVIRLFANLGLIVTKSFRTRPTFTMRQPDLQPPFHADNDATYFCNPIDLTRFFRAAGCQVLANAKLGRSPWTQMLATGTWVAAKKRN